jgi:hypothetical protein
LVHLHYSEFVLLAGPLRSGGSLQTPRRSTRGKTGAPPKRGKAINIYLHDADQGRIRELAAYLAREGLRMSDSQIIKAALLLAQPDKRFLKAYLEVKGADQVQAGAGGWAARCRVSLTAHQNNQQLTTGFRIDSIIDLLLLFA